MRRSGGGCWLLAMAVAMTGTLALTAQEPAPQVPAPPAAQRAAAPTGIVSGLVICADTQQPAHFAQVLLLNRDLLHTPEVHSDADVKKLTHMTLMVTGTARMDGHFVIENVPPGDYYAMAKVSGYLLPLARVKGNAAGQHLEEELRDVPLVHVEAYRTAETSITIHRGGLIAGRVTFDDGSPATGLQLQLHPVEGQGGSSSFEPAMMMVSVGREGQLPNMAFTDDEGRFRFPGLPPGHYKVGLRLAVSGESQRVGTLYEMNSNGDTQSDIDIFYPAAFRLADAKMLKIEGGEQITDADISIALKDLHSVRGRIRLSADAPKNANIAIILHEKGELESPPFGRESNLHPDGSFEFEYVPAGEYVLESFSIPTLVAPEGTGQVAGGMSQTNFLAKPQNHPVVVLDQDVDVGEILPASVKLPEDETGP